MGKDTYGTALYFWQILFSTVLKKVARSERALLDETTALSETLTHFVNTGQFRNLGANSIFQLSRLHITILSNYRHYKKILGTTINFLGAIATWHLGFARSCFI